MDENRRTTRTALVTGASSGIGAAIARRLAEDGYAVMAAGRDPARTRALADGLPGARAWTGDLDSGEACTRLVAECVAAFGGLDLLVNNAGIYQEGDAARTSDALWQRTLAINLTAPFLLSRAALPELRKRRGSIVNIASNWGLVGAQNAVAYCASKGGLVLLSKAMALDHAAEGVRVNAICPGDVETPMLVGTADLQGADARRALRAANAASRTGRVTRPEEVAALVAYLASDAAAQITGAAIPIDAGDTAA